MKKNLMMRAASVLLVAVMLTTCAISGTFAKYVTDDTSYDVARVAKFGVEVDIDNSMFLTRYTKTDSTYAGEYTVDSSTADKLLAPGTSGDMASLTVTGTPEVATRVTYDAVVDLGNNWIDKLNTTEFYCPLVVKIKHESTVHALCGLDYDSADAFETAIADNIRAATKDYEPNTGLSAINDDLDITWEWVFEEGLHGLVKDQTNEKDTFLGDRAAGDIGNAGTFRIDLTVTVTQID